MLPKKMVRRVGRALQEVGVQVFVEAQVVRRLRRQEVRPLRFFFWRVWEHQVFKQMFTAWKIWILVAEVFTAWKRAGSLEENSVVTQSAVPGGGAHLTNDAAASVGPHRAV